MKPCVLVTGGTGFLGSHLISELLNEGFDITVLTRKNSNALRLSTFQDKVQICTYDSYDFQIIFSLKKYDAVIHTACCYGRNGESSAQILDGNVIFGIKLLEQAIKHDVELFINTDTLLASNVSAYALAKDQFASWLSLYEQKISILNLKFDQMYGRGDSNEKFITWFVAELHKNIPRIDLTRGEQFRDIIHVSDVVAAYILLLSKHLKVKLGHIEEYEIGTGNPITIKELCNKLYHTYKLKYPQNTSILNFDAKPYRDNEIMYSRANTDKISKTGWKPLINIQNGIEDLMKELA